MAKPTDAELENRFLYHAPGDRARQLHPLVSQACLDLAKNLRDWVPDSRELSTALTKLSEVRMHANAGIACNQDRLGPPE